MKRVDGWRLQEMIDRRRRGWRVVGGGRLELDKLITYSK
jgi:hypothetical protein